MPISSPHLQHHRGRNNGSYVVESSISVRSIRGNEFKGAPLRATSRSSYPMLCLITSKARTTPRRPADTFDDASLVVEAGLHVADRVKAEPVKSKSAVLGPMRKIQGGGWSPARKRQCCHTASHLAPRIRRKLSPFHCRAGDRSVDGDEARLTSKNHDHRQISSAARTCVSLSVVAAIVRKPKKEGRDRARRTIADRTSPQNTPAKPGA